MNLKAFDKREVGGKVLLNPCARVIQSPDKYKRSYLGLCPVVKELNSLECWRERAVVGGQGKQLTSGRDSSGHVE